jgi:hypothetical protein
MQNGVSGVVTESIAPNDDKSFAAVFCGKLCLPDHAAG